MTWNTDEFPMKDGLYLVELIPADKEETPYKVVKVDEKSMSVYINDEGPFLLADMEDGFPGLVVAWQRITPLK